ncbi:type I DNA topoisomerase [Chitinophaga alhagiae]|uniref:DNA topoisomerase 1 n=1 Tax=Chitinophaga alhagiae TaxID=2203219 RepID=A0ABM6W982_9BACT|nr:type I DNA topoisomerase [Chitinophaga alhagiae]AWO00462.1 type I DNA topoisomerase [Chitinophaga alhagiae]
MAKNLVIVESPAKAKTIEKILGKDFEVKSCFGHIRDLEKDDMGIDIKNNFKPKYIIPDDKEKVVKELKKMAKDSDEVWLATDEDREGEAISWHLCEVLGLDPENTKRIVFHEITKPAIEKAVQAPRLLDMNLVNAQQARRILDRIVGFELSPVLWRKMSMRNSLSAGRVQSVAVRLIVEREREINSFAVTSTFKVEAFFLAKDIQGKTITFKAEGPTRFKTVEDAEKFLQQCIGAAYTVRDIQVKPGKKSPAAPFTTSTLQQEASRKLGYSVSKTMLLAQKLYESGKITYMRTDSVNLSETAMTDISKAIHTNYGERYFQSRKYKNKNESAQEAHEAIRPTYMENPTVDDTDQKRLYELIWKRTIASQMADAELEKTIAKIAISTNNEDLTASGEVLKFDGFLKIYMEGRDDEDEGEDDQEGVLPPLAVKQALDLKEMKATERFSRPAPRYTEASLVKKLEELGIGRPSTYAPTITTIQKRGYVEKRDKEGVKRDFRILSLKSDKISQLTEQENTGAEKAKLFPTDLGMLVTDFLKQYFDRVMDYGFTAQIEEEFDEIANGKKKWNKMLRDFYDPFHENVEETLEKAERVKGERLLGTDAETGKPVVARMGRFGPMVQIGSVEDEEKPRFAKLKQTQSIETISMEEAMDLFRLPRNLGLFEGTDVTVNIGRFGPYAQHDKKFYSLKKEMDPYTVELEEVAPLIVEKRQAKNERTIKVFEKEKIQVLKGPYGPYLKVGLKNFKIPKEKIDTAADLTVEEAKAIIEEAKANPPKKKAPPRKKKAE